MTMEQMEQLLSDLSSGYYIRQVGAILLLFLIGAVFLHGIREKMDAKWLYLLAYPMGLAIWCIVGFLLLTLSIPFGLYSEFALIALILFGSALVTGRRHRYREKRVDIEKPVVTVLIALGIVALVACVATSGILSISVSNDTMYYYMYYPEVLVQEGAYLSAYDVFLSDVGPMAAIIGTIPAMLGFDQFYGIQQVFNLNFILIFAMFLYERAKDRLAGKTAVVLTITATVLLATTTPFMVLSKWILANVYVMDYSFILFAFAYKISAKRKPEEQCGRDYMIVFMVLSAMISMLRMEGGMLMCFLILCISTLRFRNRELITRFLLPAAIMPCLYYIRYFAFLDVSPLYSFLTWQKALVAVGVMILLGHYLGAVRGKRFVRLQKRTGWLILLGLLAANIGLFAIAPSNYLIVIRAFWQNVIGQAGWGYAVYLLLICYIVICFAKRNDKSSPDVSYEELVFLGYILYAVAVSFARGDGLRQGIGDSGNRVMLQVIPFFVYAIVMKVTELIGGVEGEAGEDGTHNQCG